MSNNKLEHFPKHNFYHMRKLRVINLSRNFIESVSDFLSTGMEFQRLETLDLSANNLREFPVFSPNKGCGVNLKKLRLIRNKIDVIPEEFYNTSAA